MTLMMTPNVTREDLGSIPTPTPTKTWKPVSHEALVQAIIVESIAQGLEIATEAWRVDDGAMYPSKGERVLIPGARLYGTVDFKAPAGMDRTIQPSIGIVHSNDQSSKLLGLSGGRVMICSNGIMTGEFSMGRKHTSGLDVDAFVKRMFAMFAQETTKLQVVQHRMSALPLTMDRVEGLAVKAARAGAFSSSKILPVIEEFDKPSFEEFGKMARSLYRLYNSATHIMRDQNPGRQGDAMKALNSVTFPLIKVA